MADSMREALDKIDKYEKDHANDQKDDRDVKVYSSSSEIPAVKAQKTYNEGTRKVLNQESPNQASRKLDTIENEYVYDKMKGDYNRLQKEGMSDAWKGLLTVGASVPVGNIPGMIAGVGKFFGGSINAASKAKKEVTAGLMAQGMSEQQAGEMFDRMYSEMGNKGQQAGGPSDKDGPVQQMLNNQAQVGQQQQPQGLGNALAGMQGVPGVTKGPGDGLSQQQNKFTPMQPYSFGGY